MKLAGRRVLVTGGSRGIGAALGRGITERGGSVALVARASSDLDDVAEAIGATAYPCDLSDLAAIPRLVEEVESDGAVDVLVNNAGVSNVGWFLDRTVGELDQVLTVNLLAPMHLCRALLPLMVDRGRGHVVNISSMAGVIAPPGLAAYGASKAGLSHFTAGVRGDPRDTAVGFTTGPLGAGPAGVGGEGGRHGAARGGGR